MESAHLLVVQDIGPLTQLVGRGCGLAVSLARDVMYPRELGIPMFRLGPWRRFFKELGREVTVRFVLRQQGVILPYMRQRLRLDAPKQSRTVVDEPLVHHKGKLFAQALNVCLYPSLTLGRDGVMTQPDERFEVAVMFRQIISSVNPVNPD